MRIVWDEPKRLANLDEHGLDFARLTEAFFENALVVPGRDGRWFGIGLDSDGVLAVVFAKLGREGVSIISMRKANARERRLYAQNI